MNKNYYNIGYSRLALLLLLTMLRQNMIVAFVTALVRPLTVIHSDFDTYRRRVDTSVNSQVCYLEHLLNDAYDYYDRRIIIRDAPIDYDDFFLFDEPSGKAVIVLDESELTANDALLWVDDGKLGATNADFEVVFPKGYVFTQSEEKALRQLLNNNKLASKKYIIIYE